MKPFIDKHIQESIDIYLQNWDKYHTMEKMKILAAFEHVLISKNKTNINQLRDKFFNELTEDYEGLKKVNSTPHTVFEWFVENFKIIDSNEKI